MKKVKKITACFLALSFMFSPAVFAAEENQSPVEADDLYIEDMLLSAQAQSGEWMTTATNSSVDVSSDSKQLTLQSASTSMRQRASAEAVKDFSLSPSAYDTSITFNLLTEGFAQGQAGTVSIRDDSNKEINLIKISNKTLTVMDDAQTAIDITEGTAADVSVIFNVKSGKALISYGDYSWNYTENEALKALYSDTEELLLKLSVKNYTEKAMVSDAKLVVGDIELEVSEPFAYTGITANGTVIGGACRISDIQNGITVAFDGIAADEVYAVSNYILTVNDKTAEVSVEDTADGVLIVPDKQFEMGDKVVFTVKAVKDRYGEVYASEGMVEFLLIADDYEEPAISVSSENGILYVGQTAEIEVTTSGTEEKNVKIYINEVYKKTVAEESFTYRFNPDTAGEYVLKFVVEDKYGFSVNDEISLTFNTNELPLVNFSQYSSGETIYVSAENREIIDIEASDDVGIESINVYVNDVLTASTASDLLSFNLNVLPLGTSTIKAEAYDIYGLSASVCLTAVKTKSVAISLFSESEFISTGSSYTSGMTQHRQRGFLKTGTVDEAHGASMLIGMDETCDTENFNINQYTFAQHKINQSYAQQIYEFDLNVVDSPALNASGFNWAIRYDDTTIVTLITVNNQTISLPSASIQYTEGEWYHIKINLTKESCIITLTDKDGNETVSGVRELNPDKTFDQFRYYTLGDPANLCTFAVDNIKAYSLRESVTISGVGDEVEMYVGKVPYGITKLYVYTAGNIVGADVNADTVSLLKGSKKINLNKMKFSLQTGIAELQFDEPLEPDTKYTVEFSGDMRFEGDTTLGEKITYSFLTENEGVTVNSITRTDVNGDFKAVINVSATNPAIKTLYIFMNEFSADKRLVKTHVFEENITSDGTENLIECTLENGAGSDIQILVSDAVFVNNIFCIDNY